MLLKSQSLNEINIFIDEKRKEQVRVIRYLGLMIDDQLKWNVHNYK